MKIPGALPWHLLTDQHPGPFLPQHFTLSNPIQSNPITTEEPVVTKKDPYAYSNFQELHDLMVKVFKIVWKGPLETLSDASRKFLQFCDAVVRIRNDELQEMIENGEIFQRNEDSSPKE